MKAVNLFEYLNRIFFHGKVERESMHLVIGQFQVFHCCLFWMPPSSIIMLNTVPLTKNTFLVISHSARRKPM